MTGAGRLTNIKMGVHYARLRVLPHDRRFLVYCAGNFGQWPVYIKVWVTSRVFKGV